MTNTTPPSFPIPSSLQDLERAPYNLLPYPVDFDDDDEAARADSFDSLVDLLEDGNNSLMSSGISLFESDDDNCDNWMDEDRLQALYTLVRKSSSLAPATKARLIATLCEAVHQLSGILASTEKNENDEADVDQPNSIVSQSFRDAFSAHIYMLFTIMFFTESETKAARSGTNAKRNENKSEVAENIAQRSICADAMLKAAKSMSKHRSRLWKCGVPDESVVGLTCRISYQMLESATGVVARKAASADAALAMIAATVDSAECLLGTVVAALMDLLHSFEHMAPLVAELCCLSQSPSSRLSVELLREIGRLDTQCMAGGGHGTGGKASGLKNVAPFITELAAVRPRVVLSNISLVLPHLDSEPYGLRSAIVSAIGHILEYIGQNKNDKNTDTTEDNTNEENRMNIAKSRDALLDVLCERVYDVSSYTRTAVLKAWIRLAQGGCIPLERVKFVTSFAVDRLQDKTVMVRRSAMQLLTVLLENNPYMGCLDPEPYKKKLGELYELLKSNMPTNIREAHETAIKEAEETASEEVVQELEAAALSAAMAEADVMNDMDGLSEKENEFCSNVKALKFTQSALDFIDQFEQANDTFQGMLLSATTSDVTEALRFFVRARHFNLPCAITGMKQALALMWSSEESIRDEVLQAFVDVFVAAPGTNGNGLLSDNQIAHNLLVLAGKASVSELASIEEAIGRLVKDEKIPVEVFLILWSVASKASGEARAAAMLVLSMGASADRSIVDSASRLKLLLEAGLGDYTEEHRDWRTARSAACALQRIGRAQADPTSAKYIVIEQIMERLCAIARGDWCLDDNTEDTKMWFSASEQAIDALFTICPEPEVASAEIIKGMEEVLFEGGSSSSSHSLRLSRFFFVLGHIALKLLVYTESLSGSVRRANATKSLKKQEIADKAKAAKNNTGGRGCDDEDDIEAELGIAAEVEAENERNVADISEKEIVGRGLIGLFGPLLIRVVGNESQTFSSEILMQSSTLALCKLMCISGSFCEKHLPLLFTALANAPPGDTIMRANTVVALGDLAFRFPNEVEPYTPRLYACLRDASTKVRRHTLMVLTHLILNDMVKVKGQVCEIAMCLKDNDPRIRDMSRLLFHELSKRSNSPIYNLLPDIVSQLSQMSIKKEDFRGIMSFLLGYIKKEKQNEMLVEKLCQRFPKCTSISQKSDLAFCIAQLKTNEKSIKTLSDHFKLYKDSLFDDDVKKSFTSIAGKAKKIAKPELKECIEEWETKINEHAGIGQEDQITGQKAERAKARAAKRAARKNKFQEESFQAESSGSDGSDGEETADKENISFQENIVNSPLKNPVRQSRRVRTVA